MKKITTVLFITILLLLFSISVVSMTSCSEKRLSSDCDIILCTGRDEDGNYYELVGNQYESALDFKIEIGIIKNNTWLVELTSSFPFLSDNGFFHTTRYIVGGIMDEDLYSQRVSANIRFFESGTFAITKYNKAQSFLEEDEKVLCFFSCKTLKSTELSFTEYSIPIEPYGGYSTEGEELLIYGISGEKEHDWILFNVSTYEMKSIGQHSKGAYPLRPISEGLIFASDKCFYNIDLEKVIDLSEYDIDLSSDSILCFSESGACSFYVTNPQGKRYFVSIDKSGNIIYESPSN